MDITIPYNWTPRGYQRGLWSYLAAGGKRAVAIWHRRAGKDDVCLHWTAVAAMERPATYWHMLPEASQARKAIWEAINPHSGIRRIDEAFPHAIRKTTREQEMLIKFKNGSTWQVVGSDNYSSLVGSPPVGLVYSEWALAEPDSWAYLRPILAENGGWVIFISCVHPETLVFTKDGLREIGDIGKEFDSRYTDINEEVYGLGGFHEAEQFYHGAETDTLTIKTKRGYELICTPVHPLWNGTEWIKSGNLSVGDGLPIQYGQNVFGTKVGWDGFEPFTHGANKPIPFKPDKDFYYYLGLHIAEGCCTGKEDGTIATITIGDSCVHEWLSQFGFRQYGNRSDQSTNSNSNLCKLLAFLGCGHGALNKRVPPSVLTAPKWAQRAFLQGYFDGDGCATRRGEVSAASISEKLLRTIQVMLLNFGIVSSRYQAKKLAVSKRAAGKHLCWKIEACGGDAALFFERVGFRLARKQERQSLCKKHCYNHTIQVDYNRLPKDYFLGMGMGDTKRQFKRGKMTHRLLSRLYDDNPCDYLKEVIDRDYRFDAIASITPSKTRVCDFVIPETHSFFSNGLMSHNTPRGENHCKTTYDFGVTEPSWYSELLTAGKTGVFDPEQLEAEKRELVAQYGQSRGLALYSQEYDCSWHRAFTGRAVYHEFDRDVHVAKTPLLPIVTDAIENGHLTVLRGWDHTGLHPGCVATYLLNNQWLVFKEFWEDDCGIEDFADIVKIWCAQNLPSDTVYKDVGDPAGNRTRDARKKTAADYIREHCGISIKDGIQTFKVRRESVASRLNRRDGILIDPTECPILIAGFLGGYGYPEIGRSGIFKESISGKDKDKHADCHDALQYIATKIFGPSNKPVSTARPQPSSSWMVM